MEQGDFQKRAKRWLSAYKTKILNVPENGVWRRNKRAYEHILPQQLYKLNILPSCRDEFWKWFEMQRFRLHPDFHHLSSSQALCFNLFFPLFLGNGRGLGALLSMIRVTSPIAVGACFEFEPNLIEGTCIDFSLPLQSGARVNFEVKYMESDFGSAESDESHVQKFSSIYAPRLAHRFEESFSCPQMFLKHYQIARNIWHMREGVDDIAVFLFPKANTRLRREEQTIRGCAVEPYRSRVHILHLEDLICELQEGSQSELQEHLQEFRAKYLPYV